MVMKMVKNLRNQRVLQDARISNLAMLSTLMVTTKQPRSHVLTEAWLMARKTVSNLFASAKRANANGTTAKKICPERTCSNGSVAKLMLKNQHKQRAASHLVLRILSPSQWKVKAKIKP